MKMLKHMMVVHNFMVKCNCFALNSWQTMMDWTSYSMLNKTIVDCISPVPTLDLVTRGAAPGHKGSYSSFFLYKLFKMYYFCEIKKVSRCLKCKVLLFKRKTKSHKTTKRKYVIILVTIDGLSEKFKHLLHGGKMISIVK